MQDRVRTARPPPQVRSQRDQGLHADHAPSTAAGGTRRDGRHSHGPPGAEQSPSGCRPPPVRPPPLHACRLQKRRCTKALRIPGHHRPPAPGGLYARSRCCRPTPQLREHSAHGPHGAHEQFRPAQSSPWHGGTSAGTRGRGVGSACRPCHGARSPCGGRGLGGEGGADRPEQRGRLQGCSWKPSPLQTAVPTHGRSRVLVAGRSGCVHVLEQGLQGDQGPKPSSSSAPARERGAGSGEGGGGDRLRGPPHPRRPPAAQLSPATPGPGSVVGAAAGSRARGVIPASHSRGTAGCGAVAHLGTRGSGSTCCRSAARRSPGPPGRARGWCSPSGASSPPDPRSSASSCSTDPRARSPRPEGTRAPSS